MLVEENLISEDNIISALEEGRILAEIQAIYSLTESDKILYGKLLPLLVSEDHTQISPSEDFESFIQLIGKAPLLDRQLLQMAFVELRADDYAVLGCNISSDSLTEPESWEVIVNLMNENASYSNRLILEVVETRPFGNVLTVKARIEELRNYGVRIAIDSFGSGFISSLNLMDLRVDIVKFDEQFIQKVVSMKGEANPLEHLVSFARVFGPTIVVNGIDTEERKDLAIEAGASYGAGTFFSSNVLLSKQKDGETVKMETFIQ